MCRQRQATGNGKPGTGNRQLGTENPNTRPTTQDKSGISKTPCVAQPLQEQRLGKFSDTRFAKDFAMLGYSLQHETGNKLNYFSCIIDRDVIYAGSKQEFELYKKLCRFRAAYHKNNTLLWLALEHTNFSENVRATLVQKVNEHFTQEEKERLGIKGGIDEWIINSKEFRKITLENMRAFRTLLNEVGLVALERKQEYASNIKWAIQAGEILADAFEDLLTGTGILRTKVTAVGTEFMFASVSHAIEASGVQFRSNSRSLSHSLHTLVNMGLFSIIVKNILSNAKRSMFEKGMAEFVVDCNIYIEGDKTIFEFKDPGNGMPKEIMDALNRGEMVTTNRVEPTGEHSYGFWTSREFAEKMGGRLYVKESTIGVGTTVVLELKLAEVGQ